jgi:hypothetical protein
MTTFSAALFASCRRERSGGMLLAATILFLVAAAMLFSVSITGPSSAPGEERGAARAVAVAG